MPHFSIIIPLYNKAPYVRKAVESVVGQTYTDWEMIIVDNGSTDGSSEIVAEIVDSRIRIIRLENNIGPGAARNKGVELTSAPYITFLDADDWWEPTSLEEMKGLIERHPDAGIYGTNYYIVKNGKKRVAPIGVEPNFMEGEINYCQVYAKTLCMPITSITACIPRKVFDNTEGFPSNVKLGEDFLLWLHIALNHKVIFLNKPLSNYNQDVDITYRGTHHLHAPENNMLWHLDNWDPLEKTNPDYKRLIDNLRANSLITYLLEPRYRDAARKELSKVNWSNQPKRIQRLYNRPVWYLSWRLRFLKLGSNCKQTLQKIHV